MIKLSPYLQCKNIVEKKVRFFKNDFYDHDKKALLYTHKNTQFVFACRESGTRLVFLTNDRYDKSNYIEHLEQKQNLELAKHAFKNDTWFYACLKNGKVKKSFYMDISYLMYECIEKGFKLKLIF